MAEIIPDRWEQAPRLAEPAEFGEAGLSDREAEILGFLVRGCSNKGILRDLRIAEATMKVHVKSVLRKLRLSNRTQAAI